MSPKAFASAVIAGAVLLLASQGLYVVNETERAIKLKFREIVDADIQPGLHWKVPFIETVKLFDARVLTLDSSSARFLTAGKKYVIVDAFAKWRIEDVRAYYQATSGNRMEASKLLSNLMNKGLRDEIASRTMHDVVSGERDKLMTKLTALLNTETQAELGIEVLDVRVKAIDLPEDLSESVYQRMSAERDREAREHRSQGRELAEGIQADADRQKTVIEAEAYRDAERTRGEGDAEASRIYNAAFSKDPEFYAFTRSLNAYTETFNQNDVILLKPDSTFFRYLKDPSGN
ncbi:MULTISPECIES: protease modulator HflC [unclassified Oceanobacter]|uniref:protease modulator HflC n=1 Tax=unclassified Oceanobacter TaxID=2620260 RepID=UPI0026E2F8C5|nr:MULTISPECIES: protease modulator HflC [unclassified Oceanobacter]MDO6682403.1 protease modulator HflC [Oceanobacter sp. 5_MG-2023]MDP2505955.1 protease modulator HflC [Oceanobacter sp. 3_MG-2023]MDP2547540.1 protease modulator HflC [Oceanobacter sp. 4_MG-2023]MDP2608914.1 protease modulator HflC [Oceanobacter sp. 1_MG-2023]MDP2612101.1 protease modulator HflC [Oceanobacter sp. 2_MG-2023]